jgi:lysine biosynthesis protein LysW
MAKTLQCPECKNDIPLDKDYDKGDVIECGFCGVELEVISKKDDGTLEVEIIEEDK